MESKDVKSDAATEGAAGNAWKERTWAEFAEGKPDPHIALGLTPAANANTMMSINPAQGAGRTWEQYWAELGRNAEKAMPGIIDGLKKELPDASKGLQGWVGQGVIDAGIKNSATPWIVGGAVLVVIGLFGAIYYFRT
jgi:hypothetical protein